MGEVSESSARISIGPCEDGLSTSSTVKKTYSRLSMATRAVDCEASYESGWPNGAADAVRTISAGQMPTSTKWACFLKDKPPLGLADLLESNPPTGERDAGAPPVRFGGRGDLS